MNLFTNSVAVSAFLSLSLSFHMNVHLLIISCFYLCIHAYTRMYIYISRHKYVYTHPRTATYSCMYIHIHTYTHIPVAYRTSLTLLWPKIPCLGAEASAKAHGHSRGPPCLWASPLQSNALLGVQRTRCIHVNM